MCYSLQLAHAERKQPDGEATGDGDGKQGERKPAPVTASTWTWCRGGEIARLSSVTGRASGEERIADWRVTGP